VIAHATLLVNSACLPLGSITCRSSSEISSAVATLSRICAVDRGSSPWTATRTGRISVWKSGIATGHYISRHPCTPRLGSERTVIEQYRVYYGDGGEEIDSRFVKGLVTRQVRE
jgi:hypothetical protein